MSQGRTPGLVEAVVTAFRTGGDGFVDFSSTLNYCVPVTQLQGILTSFLLTIPKEEKDTWSGVLATPTSGTLPAALVALNTGLTCTTLREGTPRCWGPGTQAKVIEVASRTIEGRTRNFVMKSLDPADLTEGKGLVFVDDFLERGETAKAVTILAEHAGTRIKAYIFLLIHEGFSQAKVLEKVAPVYSLFTLKESGTIVYNGPALEA